MYHAHANYIHGLRVSKLERLQAVSNNRPKGYGNDVCHWLRQRSSIIRTESIRFYLPLLPDARQVNQLILHPALSENIVPHKSLGLFSSFRKTALWGISQYSHKPLCPRLALKHGFVVKWIVNLKKSARQGMWYMLAETTSSERRPNDVSFFPGKGPLPTWWLNMFKYGLNPCEIPIVLVWLVVYLPLWNIWVRHLGWWNS